MIRSNVVSQLSATKLVRFSLKRPALFVFCTALIARLLVALFVRVRLSGTVFLDDASYQEQVGQAVVTGEWSQGSLWASTPSLFRPLVVLNHLFVVDPLTSQLFVVLIGSTTSAVVAIVLRRANQSPRRVLLGGLVIALLPSQIFWSSLVLKDAFVWLGFSLIALGLSFLLAQLDDSRNVSGRIFGLLVTTLGFLSAYGARPHSAFLITISLFVAIIMRIRFRRSAFVACILLVWLVPLMFGHGPFASQLIADGSQPFAKQRALEITEAETSLTCWSLPLLGAGDPSGGGWSNDLRCLPNGALMFLSQPWPNQVWSNPTLLLPQLELPVWLGLYILAFRSLRSANASLPLRSFALSYILVTVLFWSFVDRAIGTAFRHRGELVAALVILIWAEATRPATRTH